MKVSGKKNLIFFFLSFLSISLIEQIFSSQDEKGVLTSLLLNEVMGKGPNIKWSAGSNRLQRAAQAVADAPCLVR